MNNKIYFLLFLSIFSINSFASCKWVWVDHDYNTSTPAVQKQVCGSTLDIGVIKSPSIQPIQSPQIEPIRSPTIPPIDTTQCRTQSVHENGAWVSKKICLKGLE